MGRPSVAANDSRGRTSKLGQNLPLRELYFPRGFCYRVEAMPSRVNTLLVLGILLLGAPAAPVQAAWVWSPDTGWVGPSGAVRDTPEEQLAVTTGHFEAGEYNESRREANKLLKAYPDSPQAPEAQYYVGRSLEETGDYYKAFKAYRKTLQVYPSTMRFDDILEREYQIANLFASGRKRKILGLAALLPARDKAIEIYEAIVEDAPFTEYGELAQYKSGLSHASIANYEQAVNAFEQLITRYPESPLVDDAHFQIASASLKGTFSAGYDQTPTEHAMRELRAFLREYPESELSDEARERQNDLRERRAQHDYEVGQFYEERKRHESAVMHYAAVVDEYSDTSWAPKAAERIAILEEKN